MKRRVHWIVETQDRVILVRGWQAADVLREAGMKPLWSVTGRGWVLDDKRLPDVVALAEWRNIGVRIVEAA